MEGLRGFAVLLVFLVHYYSLFSDYLPAGGWVDRFCWVVCNSGNAGVDLFFVLSGYLIYGNLLRKPVPYPVFLARRARRLYPAFLVVLSVYLLLARAYPVPQLHAGLSASAAYVAANALLLPGMLPIKPLITVAWSLSYEAFFYLTIPLVITLGKLAHQHRQSRLTLFASILAASLCLTEVSGAAHIRLLMFLGGMILYEIYDSRTAANILSRRGEQVIIVGFVAALLLSGILQVGNTPVRLFAAFPVGGEVCRQLLLFASMIAVCLYALRFDGVLKTVFTWEPLRWVGSVSYSYYLVHGLAIHAVRILVGSIAPANLHGQPIFWATVPLALGASFIAGASLFLLVEQPYSLQPARKRTGRANLVTPKTLPEGQETGGC